MVIVKAPPYRTLPYLWGGTRHSGRQWWKHCDAWDMWCRDLNDTEMTESRDGDETETSRSVETEAIPRCWSDGIETRLIRSKTPRDYLVSRRRWDWDYNLVV